jgi:Outer membrane protein beta-barrel domain
MKKIIIVSFFGLSLISLVAQEQKFTLGILGGNSFSSIIAENYLEGNYSSNLGFGGEVSCAININQHIFIMTNVGLLQRGFVYNYETPVHLLNAVLENSYFGIEFKSDHNYLNNDWLFGFKFGNTISMSLCGGAYYSYYLNTRNYDRNYTYIDPDEAGQISDPAIPLGYSENELYSKNRNQNVSNWDYGIVGGINVGYMINDRFTLQISGRYYYGLHDISEIRFTEEVSMYNRSIVIFVGIKVRI